jgi:EAL and modified HD-GYP domain-containing signal transduction protein
MAGSIDELIGRGLAFVNATEELLCGDFLETLPAERTVIEVLEDVRPTSEVLDACMALRRKGFQIALDDFQGGEELDALARQADIIKVDFLQVEGEDRRRLFERYANEGRRMLAEKVETRADFDHANEIGYRLFQGYFFFEPETITRKALPRYKLNYVQLIQELSRPSIDLDRIQAIFERELSLSVMLLRYLNSAYIGLRNEITSLRHALIYLGERPLKQWGSFLALSGLGEGQPEELIVTSLVRARFAEALGETIEPENPSAAYFLVGLLSALDAVVGRPMQDILNEVAVHEDVRTAILGDDTPRSKVLDIVRRWERAEWAECAGLARGLGLDHAELGRAYMRAVKWVEDVYIQDQAA